jgi:hypothetical protein
MVANAPAGPAEAAPSWPCVRVGVAVGDGVSEPCEPVPVAETEGDPVCEGVPVGEPVPVAVPVGECEEPVEAEADGELVEEGVGDGWLT